MTNGANSDISALVVFSTWQRRSGAALLIAGCVAALAGPSATQALNEPMGSGAAIFGLDQPAPKPRDCSKFWHLAGCYIDGWKTPGRGRKTSAAADASHPAGVTVYRANECIGAVVNSQCHGAVQPSAGYHPVCHGQIVGGQCTGPVF